jgi:hypothetical protein
VSCHIIAARYPFGAVLVVLIEGLVRKYLVVIRVVPERCCWCIISSSSGRLIRKPKLLNSRFCLRDPILMMLALVPVEPSPLYPRV